MTTLNALLVRLADAVLAPLAGLSPLAVVTGAALATALVVLAAMRATSDQAALAAVKRRIHAALLEMRLYNDDLRALLRAQGEVIRHNLRYVGLSLVPLVVTAIPLTLAIAQLQAWYGYDGLTPGQPTTITATVAEGMTALPRLESPAVEVVGPPRYFPTRHEVVWRVVPRQPGASSLRVVSTDGLLAEKTLQIGPGTARRSPSRERAGFVQQLLYPSEGPIDDGVGVHAVTVPYAERALDIAGLHVHWLVAYLVLAVAWVLVLRGPMGVVI